MLQPMKYNESSKTKSVKQSNEMRKRLKRQENKLKANIQNWREKQRHGVPVKLIFIVLI